MRSIRAGLAAFLVVILGVLLTYVDEVTGRIVAGVGLGGCLLCVVVLVIAYPAYSRTVLGPGDGKPESRRGWLRRFRDRGW
jgi:hypothetical protein